jgi:alpha-glucosidase
MNMKHIVYILLLALGVIEVNAKDVAITSPNGKFRMRIYEREEKLFYTVDYNGYNIILESALGISGNQTGRAIESGTSDNDRSASDWYGHIRIDTAMIRYTDMAWRPVYGERNLYIDLHNEYTIDLSKTDNSRRRLQIIIRAYNEGIGFCYRFTGNEYLHITQEFTEYSMPEGTMAWFTSRAQARYEKVALEAIPDLSEREGLKGFVGESERPLVCEIPNGTDAVAVYVLLTEAAMTDYARTRFALDPAKPNTLKGVMYGAVDEIAPYQTPWRVIMAAERSTQLLENNFLLLNLNKPCEIKDPSWIRPGKVIREVTLTTEGGKALVDFAVRRNLQYIHFDSGWYGAEGSKQSDATTVSIDPARNLDPDALDLREVITYAKSKGIGVILYVNQRALYQQLDEILPLYEKWGVSGVKFGFVQVGSQFWTKWMHEAIKKCAQYHLLVDVHDEYRPTGFSRTYPNLMTQEGIYGNEEFPDATHNVTLPFTRFTQGAADYTICYYRRKWDATTTPNTAHGLVNAKLLKTTPAHQLAMAVVYYSPLQYMYWYDKPSDSRDEPELEFFDHVKTVWDDTKVLHGEIGEYVTVARRSGNEWFVGAMTNNDARQLKIPLTFLETGKKYRAHVYYDNPPSKTKLTTRTNVGIKTLTVTNKTVLEADLLPSGGQAVRIEPILDMSAKKSFKHPGVLHISNDFKGMRKLIAAQKEPAYGSYLLLKEHPFSQADYKMKGPFRVISRDGEFRHTKSAMESDFHAVYQNVLMYVLTGDKAHANKTLEILTAYADSLAAIPDTNDAPLLAGLEGFKIIYAMEILRHSSIGSENNLQHIERMFRNIFIPVLERFYSRPPYTNGNWGPIVTKTYMAAGIYFDDEQMYAKAKNFYLDGNDNGTIANYIDSDTGQIQESGRDQAHSQLGIGAMAIVCELAWKQGDDLWSSLNNRLLKGYEYVARYNLGDDNIPFKQWQDVTGKYGNWTVISSRSRGVFRPVYEIAYNHYITRKRMQMTYTQQVLKKIRPEGFNGDQPPAFGSLLFTTK